ncbi:hypothetical protein IU500_17460 [Nocardia terpenica]|uniref:hypothetical protein n=1 Tax=Nocardia terpenica TaxID=455432 RepID=UPI0018936129|nr:hypothetical protein [Nocardia terpenica]MBF6063273.1 hypothetical protein [Nocardia terpenica]MBF6105829.1 hypothetical protein [Nocardia terpenica]MBF6113587.1 hypothetical protein [Nocardia terpenica]MBF6119570.1 hypothetical protein [Nocardia terpenica]MBF6151981.1 hypothetical protein [Nocardia terpenica]
MLKISRAPWRDAQGLAGYSEWCELASKRLDKARAGNLDLRYYMTRGLVYEIILAAGGMECEIVRLEELFDAAQSHANAMGQNLSVLGAVAPGLGLSSAHYAQFSMGNIINSARTFQERIHHRYRDRVHKRTEEYGLLPALEDGKLRKKLKGEYYRGLLSKLLGESRLFANYGLHLGVVGGPSTPSFRIRQDGTVYLPFPDSVSSRVTTWNEFEYNQSRDALSYGRELFSGIADFVDRLFDAFDSLVSLEQCS